jgi:hypothetical protein
VFNSTCFGLRGHNQVLQINKVNCNRKLIKERDIFLYLEEGYLQILIHVGVNKAKV